MEEKPLTKKGETSAERIRRCQHRRADKSVQYKTSLQTERGLRSTAATTSWLRKSIRKGSSSIRRTKEKSRSKVQIGVEAVADVHPTVKRGQEVTRSIEKEAKKKRTRGGSKIKEN